MEIPSNNNCPKLVDPSIIHYNDAFYICGKETKDDAKGFQKFYTSPTLLVWKGVDRMFMLPGILPPVKLEGGITHILLFTNPASREKKQLHNGS